VAKGVPPESAYTIDRERLTHVDGVELASGAKALENAETFKAFELVASSIRQARIFKVYEGLPHVTWESDSFEAELKKAKTIEIAHWPFYADAVKVSDDTVAKLLELASSRTSFVPFHGYKMCGGLHPDWCVCENDELILYCEMWDGDQFKYLLNPLHSKRPPEKFD